MSDEHDIKAGVDLARVRAAIAPALSARSVSLVDVEWGTDRGGWVLRITIEREDAALANLPTGGVSLEDCADVSRDVSAVLDADEELVPHQYNLEVSSPGLDRPLRTEAEFARFAGKLAKVKLRRERALADGQRVLRGPIERVGGGLVTIVADGKPVELAIADVAEANLVFELAPQAKRAEKSGKKRDEAARSSKSGRASAPNTSPQTSPRPAADDERRGSS